MSHTGDRCKTEALIKQQGRRRTRGGSQEGCGLALEGRLALGLSWDTACDTDDLSPSSVQIITKPWPSPWVVLISIHSPRGSMDTDTGWAVQNRVSMAGKPTGTSSVTALLQSISRALLASSHKGRGRKRGLLPPLPSHASHRPTQASRAASKDLR